MQTIARTGDAMPSGKNLAMSVWILRLAWALPYLCLAGAAYSVFAETVDDPYITFRYAANLLAGHGPVFNIGEHVEGYTSPLHLLLSTALLVIAPAVDILFKAKCLSLFFAFVMVAQTGILGRRSGLRSWEALLAQILVAANINFALASVNALETTLYGAILLSSLMLFQQECRSRGGIVSGLLLFTAMLARPEALLIAAALFLVRLYWMRNGRLPVQFVIGWLGAFLLPSGIFEAARWSYYGQLLPNTYFAKARPLPESLSDGIRYPLRAMTPIPSALEMFSHNLLLLNPHNLLAFHSLLQKNLRSDLFSIVMFLLFWGLAIFGFWRVRRRIFGIMSLATVVAVLAFVLKAGGDWMYGWRFMVPVLPILAIAQCFGIRTLSQRIIRLAPLVTLKSAMQIFGLVASVLWIVSCIKTNHYTWKSANFSTSGRALLQASEGYGPLWVKGADYIQRFPPGTSIAYSEMGYAGFANMDKYMLDIRGLTDREVAQLPAKYKFSTGIADKDWYRPGDPLCRILQKRKPKIIISFDGLPPQGTLSGYRRLTQVAMPTPGAPDQTFAYVFERRG